MLQFAAESANHFDQQYAKPHCPFSSRQKLMFIFEKMILITEIAELCLLVILLVIQLVSNI